MGDEQLHGGISNAGKVSREGPHVVRPADDFTPSVHALLRSVRHAGFTGAPTPVGIDDGRERLVFIEGDVPVAPYPPWSQTDTALASIARLVRGLHDAAHDFDVHAHSWNDTLADPEGGEVVCHNDIELSNVVFRDGAAVALLDFDFAAPGRRVYDLAQLARLCVPIDDELDQTRLGWHPADRPSRLRIVADAYGLDAPRRAQLVDAIDDALDRIESAARRNAGSGDPNQLAVVERTGGLAKYDRRRSWWTRHRSSFIDALT